MNDNNLGFDTKNNDNTYRVTTNLNTAIENPQFNINGATGVNIYNSDTNVNNNYDYSLNNNVGVSNYNNNLSVNNDQFINDNHGLENIQTSSSFSSNNEQVNSSFIPQDIIQNNNAFIPSEDIQSFNNTQNNFISNNVGVQGNFEDMYSGVNSNENAVNDGSKVTYAPTMKKKKNSNSNLEISKEVKMMAVIILVLLIFVFVIPYIYDFCSKLGLIVTS